MTLLLTGLGRPADAAGGKVAGQAAVFISDTFAGIQDTYQFGIQGSSPKKSIGSVSITVPSGWFVDACPLAPAGWTAVLKTKKHACRYNSAKGTADNITAGSFVSDFELTAHTENSDTDRVGTWKVKLDANSRYNGGRNSRLAAELGPNALTTKAHVFELRDATVTNVAPALGDPCPTSKHSGAPGQITNIAVCGISHAPSDLQPTAADSSLDGSFIDTPGVFDNGTIPGSTDTVVVVANYSATKLATSPGNNLIVNATLGAGPDATSTPLQITDYSIVPDATPPTPGNVYDGPPDVDLNTQRERTSMSAFWDGFDDTGSGIASYTYNLSSDNTCTGDVIPDTPLDAAATSTATTGLSLQGDHQYFNCLKATDGANNSTSFVASDGVFVKPLAFNPNSKSFGVLSTATSTTSSLENLGDTTCSGITYSSSDPNFAVSGGPTTLAPGAQGTVTVTRPNAFSFGHSTTITADAGPCGTASLTVSD